MRRGRRHGRWQDAAHLRQGLQQEGLPLPAAQHARAHSLGHRSVPHLQGSECQFDIERALHLSPVSIRIPAPLFDLLVAECRQVCGRCNNDDTFSETPSRIYLLPLLSRIHIKQECDMSRRS